MATVNLQYRVPAIAQQDVNYCWACALAMLLGRHSWQAALEIADLVPRTARERDTGRLLNIQAAARAVGLNVSSAPSRLTPDAMAARMRRGAVAVFGAYGSGGHVMVVSSLRGDTDDPDSLVVGVHDPWANGNRWTGSWDRWCGSGGSLRRAEWFVNR